MPDAVLIVLLVFILYFPVCLLIAFIRALFSKKHRRKENFKNTFWTFFLEILNPLNWFEFFVRYRDEKSNP